MSRKKLKLAYITNDSTRKATFKKRRKGLMKKVRELSTLCDIPVCAIVYNQHEMQPEVWPSPLGARHIITEFKNMPEMEQTRKMMNLESFLRQRIEKAREQLTKLRKENREKLMTKAMYECLTGKSLQGLTMMDLNDLGWLIDQNLRDITDKIKSRNAALADQMDQAQVAPIPTMVPAAADQDMNMNMHAAMERQAFELNNMETVQRPSWFMDNVIQPLEHLGFSHGDESLPFGDQNYYARWSSNPPFFP